MIYQDYEIWTNYGWERIGRLYANSNIMIFNSKNRMSKFEPIKNFKEVQSNENILLENSNFDFIVSKNNTFLNEKYQIIRFDNMGENKILIDSRTFFVPNEIRNISDKKRFYTFDLEPDKFVLIKNKIQIYIGWNFEKSKKGLDKVLRKTDKIK